MGLCNQRIALPRWRQAEQPSEAQLETVKTSNRIFAIVPETQAGI